MCEERRGKPTLVLGVRWMWIVNAQKDKGETGGGKGNE